MSYRANPSDIGWNTTLNKLQSTFDKWRAKSWGWKCFAADASKAGRTHWSRYGGQPHEVQVTVTWTDKDGGDHAVTVSRHGYPQDNLWAIQLGLDSIRLNELRGLDEVERQFYGALPAPRQEKPKRDPWEVLELAPNASRQTIEAVYRVKAKALHPDINGGDAAAFKELQEAYEAVKGS